MAYRKVRPGYGPEVGRRAVPQNYLNDRAGSIIESGGQNLARGLSDLSGGLEAVREAERDKKEREDAFAAQMALVDAENNALVIYDNEKAKAPLGANSLPESATKAVGEANKAFIERHGDLSDRARNALQLGLQNIQQSVLQKSLAFRQQSRGAKFALDMQAAGEKFANLVLADPDEVNGVMARIDAVVDTYPNDEITEIEREELREKLKDHVRHIAGLALTKQDPQRVVDAFRGKNSSSVVGTILKNSDLGLKDYMVAAVLGNLYAESKFSTGAIGDSGTAFGIAQWRGGRIANLKKFAAENKVDWRKLTTQSHFILWEMVNTHPKALKALLRSKNVREATAAVAKYYEKPQGSQSGDGSGAHNFSGRLAAAQQVLAGVELRGGGSAAGEGDPVIEGLTAAQRLQILSKAEAEIDSRRSDALADLKLDVSNELAALRNGEAWQGGMSTREDFAAAYEDPDDIARNYQRYLTARHEAETQGEFHDLNNPEISKRVADLRPTQEKSGDNYASDLAGYNSVVTAMNEVFQARRDGAQYLRDHSPAVQAAIRAGDPIKLYRTMEAEYARLGIPKSDRKPFSDAQAADMKTALKDTPSTELFKEFLSLSDQMPAELYQAGLRQLDSAGFPEIAHLIQFHKSTKDPKLRTAIQDALIGMDNIKNDDSLKKIQSDFQEHFEEFLGREELNAISSGSGVIYNTAMGHYQAQGGSLHKYNPKAFEKSVRIMLGGDGTADTGVYTHNGSKTFLPIGITGNEFSHWIESNVLPGEQGAALFQLKGNGIPVTESGELVSSEEIGEKGAFIRVTKDTYQIDFDDGSLQAMLPNGMRVPFELRVTHDDVKNSYLAWTEDEGDIPYGAHAENLGVILDANYGKDLDEERVPIKLLGVPQLSETEVEPVMPAFRDLRDKIREGLDSLKEEQKLLDENRDQWSKNQQERIRKLYGSPDSDFFQRDEPSIVTPGMDTEKFPVSGGAKSFDERVDALIEKLRKQTEDVEELRRKVRRKK